MRIERTQLRVPDGVADAEIAYYTDSKEELKQLFDAWQIASNLSVSLKGRKINIPEALSEGAFCLAMNVARAIEINGNINKSFDCIDTNTGNNSNFRIQVKATSVPNDLTSFGPNTVWDKIYLCDFSRVDGTFDIYLIENDLIYNNNVNNSQTMREMQATGKRPRMSLKLIIATHNILPILTYDLNS